ncbi:hypothetical protein DY000_02003130 [Brassica cretica]|uniref:Uncharacterized protein n=1 Tax=Brassica cretica TaxID=69181 RepID=A0ABQ7CJL4_BRACR|nr:hypothetical protein DY000_02003130 [Brassica cretica]
MLVAAGDKDGNVGFWNLDCQNEEEDGGVSLFKPHTYSVTSLVFQQNSFSKVTLQSTYLVAHEPDDDNILRTRTNDISITKLITLHFT